MKRHTFWGLLAVSLLLAGVAQNALAQGFGGTNTISGVNNSAFGGGNVAGSNVGGTTTTGLSSRFGSDFSRFQGGGSGQSTFVGAAMPTNAGFGAQNQGAFGGGAFGRNGINTALQFGTVAGFGRSAFGRQGQQGLGNTTQQQRQIRTRVRVGFERPVTEVSMVPASTAVARRFETRLTRITQVRAQGAIQVLMQGRTAILRGVVESQHDKDLAQRLAMLEPGIGDVQNELTVQGAAMAPAGSAGSAATP